MRPLALTSRTARQETVSSAGNESRRKSRIAGASPHELESRGSWRAGHPFEALPMVFSGGVEVPVDMSEEGVGARLVAWAV